MTTWSSSEVTHFSQLSGHKQSHGPRDTGGGTHTPITCLENRKLWRLSQQHWRLHGESGPGGVNSTGGTASSPWRGPRDLFMPQFSHPENGKRNHIYQLPWWLSGRKSASNAGDVGSIPQSPGEGNSNPLQYSWLGNPMDRGAWRATVHGVARVEHNWTTQQLQQQSYLPPRMVRRLNKNFYLEGI